MESNQSTHSLSDEIQWHISRQLRGMGYVDLPIYGLTASVGRSDFAELGFNDWLPKPIPMKRLKEKLAKIRSI
jgi:CheY-like chemotaxis protein